VEQTVVFARCSQSPTSVERGSSLLGLATRTGAASSAGVNTSTSSLRSHPYVLPRIEALESSVADLSRKARRRAGGYARAAEGPAPASVFARSLRAALSTTGSRSASIDPDVRRTLREP
jgi:hypothetical protein